MKIQSQAAARAYRLGSKPDFLLGNCHPVVDWAEKEPEIDPEELVKVVFFFFLKFGVALLALRMNTR